MSITVTQLCNDEEYVYNPFYYSVTSTNSSKLNHRFIFDLFEGVTNPTTYIGRFKLPVRPDNICVFSPARILEAYVQNKFTPNATALTQCYESQHTYRIYFGEEYDDSTSLSAATGVTIYSAITSTGLKHILNAVKQYDNSEPLSARTYNSNYLLPELLTDWDSTYAKKIRFNEYETLSFYKLLSNNIIIRTFDINANQIGEYNISDGYDANVNRYNAAAGTENLDYSATNLYTGGTDVMINSSVDSYQIEIGLNGTGRSTTYTYTIDNSCPKYELKRIAWLNSWGAYDYFTFSLITTNTISKQNTEWEKYLGYNYSIGDRGRTVLVSEVRKRFTVVSDWISTPEADFLNNCFTSIEHHLVMSDGSYRPLIMVDKDFQTKNTGDNKLFNYVFTFEYAYDVNTQRT